MSLESRPNNLLEVDALVDAFLREHASGIATVHRVFFHNSDPLSVRALVAELMDVLRTGSVTFINKNDDLEGLNSYLFYIVNDYCKKKAVPQLKKKTEYLCPGCLFLKKENLVTIINKVFKCEECEDELRQTIDPKKIAFFRTFFKHNKNGYHCEDCDRFIPHPLDDSPIVACPYFDCCFVGQWSSLGRMHHPSSQSNVELLTLDAPIKNGSGLKGDVPDAVMNAQDQLEIREALENKVALVREVIDYQSNNVPYSSSDFTVKHKCLAYQAFDNLLTKYPTEMVDYLLNKSRSGGFQHKIFQEYIRLLEESLPFTFKKHNKLHKVESLLDENLSLFGGISVFDGVVNERLTIKNNTQEFYIGGRKAKVTKPYYIGKLLSVVRKDNKEPIIDLVSEYTFSLIKIKDITPGTKVIVTHLRVPPHYQMGGMVYINRVRKKIVDRAILLENSKDE
jgi:hypothetical protein